MEINTKYEIGQHVWHIYENKGEVCVFDDFIGWITIEDGITYGLKESYADVKEEDYYKVKNQITKAPSVRMALFSLKRKLRFGKTNPCISF